jgi:hypothetical protein
LSPLNVGRIRYDYDFKQEDSSMGKKGFWNFKKIFCFAGFLSIFFFLNGCGGGGGSSPSSSSSTNISFSEGQVLIGFTDAAGDFVRYAVDVTAIKLHRTNGTEVNAIPTNGTTTIDFTQLTNMTEFLTAATVGTGLYDKVVLTLDYTNAEIQVYDSDGSTIVQIPTADIELIDENGEIITSKTIDVTVDLDSNLLVSAGRASHLALDFNLNSNNVVDLDELTLKVTPIITADLTPDTTKIQRVRGALQSVDTVNNSFEMTVHPFAHDITGDDAYGTVTVLTNSNTLYNINGTNYSSTAGLTELADLDVDVPVVAHGTFNDTLHFTATEVLAGISVKGLLDSVKGTVISRTADTLTIKGATMCRDRSKGGDFFKKTITVNIGDTTKVSKQFSLLNYGISDVSVGQAVEVFGTYSHDAGTMDASDGYIRMQLTTISGKLNYPPAGDEYTANPTWLSLSLYSIETMSLGWMGHNTARWGYPGGMANTSLFDFTGTGIDADHDASITDYTVSPAANLDVSSLTVNGMPVKMKGFMRPFGTAPADFDAQTIIDLSETKAFLNVGLGFEGQTVDNVFTESPTEAAPLILNGETISSVGFFHSVIRGGSVIDFVKDHPDEDITIQADADHDHIFVITVYGHEGSRTVYTSWSEFITALNSACADGALITHLHGLGVFNDNTLTFSAYHLSVALVKTTDTEE